MQDNRLKEFTAKFRKDYGACQLLKDHQHLDVFFRQYKGGKSDLPLLGELVAGSIGQLTKIKRLIKKIACEHRGNFCRLCGCLDQLKLELLQLVQAAQPGNQFNRILVVVDAFQFLVNSFQRNVHDQLLRNVKAVAAKDCAYDAYYIASEDIDAVILLIETYTDELQRFYDEMDIVLYGDGTAFPKQVDKVLLYEQLVMLLTLVEQSIILEEELQIWLESWKVTMAIREMQQLLN